MKDVVLFDELKAPVASADASPVDDSADDDDDDIDVDDHFFGDFVYDVPPGHDPVEFVHDNDPFVLPWENEVYVEEFSITAGPVKESAKVEGQVPR